MICDGRVKIKPGGLRGRAETPIIRWPKETMRNDPLPKVVFAGREDERDELAEALAGRGRPGIAGFVPAAAESGGPAGGEIPAADIIVVSRDFASGPGGQGWITRAVRAGIRVADFPSYYEEIARRTPVDRVPASWILESRGLRRMRSPAARRSNRAFDILGSLAALTAGLPLLLIIAAMIKLTSRGPLFFIQERVGKGRSGYRMWKFRTMIEGAEADGPQWAEENDLRATRFGRFLRRTRLDELPQFLNVLGGTMSIVGPRPEREPFVRRLAGEIPLYALRFESKPGITGWAQVHFPYTASVEDSREKLKFDLYYLRRFSPALDLRIVLRTVRVMLFGLGR